MPTRVALLLVIALSFCLAPHAAVVASAQVPSDTRVVVVLVPESSPERWRANPALRELLDDGASALLSTRAGRVVGMSSAVATLGAGARTDDPADGRRLAEALANAGIPFVVSSSLQSVLGGSRANDAPHALPRDSASRMVAILGARGVVDTTVSTRDMLASVRARMAANDVLIVMSPLADADRPLLGMIAIVGRGFARGLLHSPSTRLDGVVTLVDVAPTILSVLDVPHAMDGRPLRVEPTLRSAETLAALDRDLVVAARARYPLSRGMLALVGLALLAGALALMRGARGLPRSSAMFLTILAVASPFALYVQGAFSPSSRVEAIAVAAGLAFVVATVTFATMDVERALLVITGATAGVVLVDLLTGGTLAARSAAGISIASGGRFYGADDGMLGIVVGAALLCAGLAFDRGGADARVRLVIALGFAAAIWILGAPQFGSKFGAAPTALPAFAVFALRADRRRITWRSVAVIVIATVVVTGALVLVDAVRSPEAQSHVARAAEGRSGIGAMISRKLSATSNITVNSIWTRAVAVYLAIVGAVVWRRRRALLVALERRDGARAALWGCLVASVAGFVTNDGGIVTVTPIAMFASLAVFALALARPPAGEN